MIKKIRSKLSVKVFMITFLLLVSGCAVTYLCLTRFAPYIYTHELSEAEEIAQIMSVELSHVYTEEADYFIAAYRDILSEACDDEFVFHLFTDSGEEIALPHLDTFSGGSITNYQNAHPSKEYRLSFADSPQEYILLLTGNEEKESQIIEALQRSLPILCVTVAALSFTAALFYTWYLTKPVKQLSQISKQMADLDFSGLCPVDRTDETGVLARSLNELSAKLSASLTALQDANRKLQADIDKERQLEKQRTAFFSAASHELKTPVTIIRGQLQGMLYQVGRYKDRETYLARSLEVTDALENIIQELLTISRLDTPGFSCSRDMISLSRLSDDRLTACEDLLVQKDLTLEKQIAPDIFISGDERLLQKALDNLLGNAAAYSEPGNTVSVSLWREDERAKLTVENTGAHIPEEAIPRLFEAFYRVDQSRNRQTGGTGLGLYIVKTILDLHDAAIQIANTDRGVIVSLQFFALF